MTHPLIKEFVYEAPPEKVWHALTDAGSLRQWYFPQLLAFEPVAGFDFRFADEGAAYRKEWTVTRVEPGKTLAHSWAYKGYPGGSEVTFSLAAGAAATTRLTVTQTGLERFPDDPHFRRARFERGWDTLLGTNLRDLLRKG